MYMRDIKEKACKNSGKPEVLCERAATAWVNGNNLLGPVVGNFCIDLAIQKAKQSGIGWVVANRKLISSTPSYTVKSHFIYLFYFFDGVVVKRSF